MNIISKIKNKDAQIGVLGLGYVGLPLLMEYIQSGFNCVGFDIDANKVEKLCQGESYIKHIPAKKIKDIIKSGRFKATTDFSEMIDMNCLIVAVPTPLDKHQNPDLSYIRKTSQTISQYLQKEQLVILESSTWPGTTMEVVKPILENSGLKYADDFYLAFSPEREDPNNSHFTTKTIPKVVGANDDMSLQAALALYNSAIERTVPVSSTQAAEATKLLENIFRSVNIALVNEMKMIFDRMDIDVWEVIDAASTKPFGFMPFYPGPGLGGHCIPIDPFYLTWKAREFDIPTRFIELAGEINTYMPYYVVEKVMQALNKKGQCINNSKILILGLAYKKDVDDMRESPTLKLIDILMNKGAQVDFNDPMIPVMPKVRKYDYQMASVDITAENLKIYDCVIISTDHSAYDYEFILHHSSVVVDTRNSVKKCITTNNAYIVKA